MGYHVDVKVLLLTSRPELKTNRRLVDAADRLGHLLTVVDTTTLSAVASRDGLRAVGDAAFDFCSGVVIARVGNWRPESALAVLEALVAGGAATPYQT